MGEVEEKLKSAALELAINELKANFEDVPELFSEVANYASGCVIGMEMSDATDRFYDCEFLIPDGYPTIEAAACLFDVFWSDYFPQSDEDATAQLYAEIFVDQLKDTEFFRFKDDVLAGLNTVNDVLNKIKTILFWSPDLVMLNGKWFDTNGVVVRYD